MAADDTLPAPDLDAVRREIDTLRTQRDEYQKAIYAILWQSVSPPTAEELGAAEPVGPWFDDLIQRLERPAGAPDGR